MNLCIGDAAIEIDFNKYLQYVAKSYPDHTYASSSLINLAVDS